jgi:predicted acetyltransferase
VRIFWVDDADFDIDYNLEQEPSLRVVMANGKSLVSYATVVWRDIELAGRRYQCAGLGDVMTFPAFRKQGYGGQVVKTATDLIRADGAVDVGLLWTAPHNTHFYERYGWEPMPDLVTLEGDLNAPDVLDDEPAMMLFTSDKGRAGRADFERGQVYIGEGKW